MTELYNIHPHEYEIYMAGRKGGIIRYLKEGYQFPKMWGLYRWDYMQNIGLIAPIPLNFIFRWLYDLKMYLIRGSKRRQIEEKYIDMGFNRCLEELENAGRINPVDLKIYWR